MVDLALLHWTERWTKTRFFYKDKEHCDLLKKWNELKKEGE